MNTLQLTAGNAFTVAVQFQTGFKGDERILENSDFVEKVLYKAAEKMERKYKLESMGYDLDKVIKWFTKYLNRGPKYIIVRQAA